MAFFDQSISGFNISDLNIPMLRFNDCLDIIIVAFLIYHLVLWVKETRAWSLFKGVIVVFFFSVIAVILQLNTILWILSNTLSVGIIAVIVLFQPELRKALEQLGKGYFLSNLLTTETDEENGTKCSAKTFKQILEATTKMSKVKTGALILIEQSVPLGDFKRTGILIDAIVTKELLINIFEHNTPLHDGAVIIKGNRIVAASCFLPLTESALSMELGTRHRAAVGASEVSDAFVIVVSEETGSVSVAKDGKLYREQTEDEIHKLFFGSSRSVKKRKQPIWKGRKK